MGEKKRADLEMWRRMSATRQARAFRSVLWLMWFVVKFLLAERLQFAVADGIV